MTKKIKCPVCNGWGTLKDSWVKCAICNGYGIGCKTCKGKGKLRESCRACGGAGWYKLKEVKTTRYGSQR